MSEQQPACEWCRDTGLVTMLVRYTDRRRPCAQQVRPCPMCEAGAAKARALAAAPRGPQP